MDKDRSVMPWVDARPRAAEPDGSRAASESKTAPPADNLKRTGSAGDIFSSVLCGVDRSVNSRAAHHQAVWLASPAGAVDVVPAPELTRHGHRTLHDACEDHDLLVLGAGAGATSAVEHAPIPVLIGRWIQPGIEVTARILVAVDDSPESRRAVELAARLAAAHGSTVTALVAPRRDPGLQRAIAASRRILIRTTGAAPTLVGEQLPRERAVPATAAAINASLVVLGTGNSQDARRTTAQTAARISAAVLVVPPPRPAPEGRVAVDTRTQ
jgi:nucleotide-binding universal stress UspA family protein